MSLLLEALKKAERDKLGLDPAQRNATGQSALSSSSSLDEASAEETLPGYPPPPPGGTLELMRKEGPTPPLRQHSDPVRQESAHERAAAQNVFTAKQGGVGGVRAGKLLMVAGVVLITISGGAYYVWQEVTRTSGLSQPQVARMPSAVAVVSPPAPVAPAIPAAPIAKEATPLAPSPVKDSIPLSHKEREGSSPPLSAGRRGAGEVTAEPAIRIQRKQSANEVPPLLVAAYQAYLAGDLSAARQQYRQQLQNDPLNKNALLGLAAIAVRMRQPDEAQTYYLRILELDPRDPSAIAGMTGLGQQLNPSQAQTESRLKVLLAQQPDAAALHFTLGNHYASQSRWGEAQQAFFRALSIDATNAEYAFNLAVSLDHLNQSKLAAEYYNKALALAGATPTGFDKAQATTRIKELAR